jgi:hypothetical protein
MSATNHITDEVKALIGYTTEWVEAYDIVDGSSIRRFHQAIMDDDPIYWDREHAAASKYRGLVAPPLFPLHAFRRPPGTPDPLKQVSEDPNFDGVTRDFGLGLPPPAISLPRLMNAGIEVEVYQLARPGERILARSRYIDIYQKEGKSGALVFIVVETIYRNDKEETLLKSIQTYVLR